MSNLTRLDLAYSDLSDEGIKNLKPLENLTHLRLASTLMSGSGLGQLAMFKNLKQLEVVLLADEGGADFTGLGNLNRLPNLTKLCVNAVTITADGFKNISSLKLVSELVVECVRPQAFSANELKELREMKSLRRLGISKNLNPEEVGVLMRFPKLTELSVRSDTLTDKELLEFERMVDLKRLELNAPKVTAGGISEFLKKLPRCELITPSIMESLRPIRSD